MYIPLWLLRIIGFSVVCCMIGVIVQHAEKERNLDKRIKELEEELEEKIEPANRLSRGEYETYHDPPDEPLDL